MSANGQNPSCSQTRTESTKVWFGWWVSNFSKVSMSILQTILNRSSQSIIIACLTQLFSATGLGHGNGFVVSEYPAVGPNSSSLIFHRYFLAHFSLLPITQYHSSLLAHTFLFSMSFLATSDANMSVLTLGCLLPTFSLIEQSTWVLTLPCGHSSTLSCQYSLLIPLCILVSCHFTEDMLHFEKSKFLELVKWHIVDRSRPVANCFVKIEDAVLPSCIGRCKEVVMYSPYQMSSDSLWG